jgi:hypothetical protein
LTVEGFNATDDSVDRARTIYDSQLRERLEPEYNGQWVAIHPDTGDYIVERRFGKAFRALKAKHPDGSVVVRYIGIADAGLRARLFGENCNGVLH